MPDNVDKLMYAIPPYLIIALTQIGVTEIQGTESNPKIDQFLQTVGMPSDDDIPWCAAFVNWCLETCSIGGTGRPNARSFLTWGVAITPPEVGCITVLKRGRESWMGHVGFYLDESNSFIRLLGGNQLNRVGINNYNKSKVLGYRAYVKA